MSSAPPPDRAREGGFALLAALVALLALSAIAAAGAWVSGSERRIADSHRATVEAREVARSGLSEYLATNGSAVEADTFAYGSDTAYVTAERLLFVKQDSSESLHRVTSRGMRSRGGGRHDAERTVSTVVLASGNDSVTIAPTGAVVSSSTVSTGATGVQLRGWDACHSGSTEDVAGAVVPPGGNDIVDDGAQGNPNVSDTASATDLLRHTGIDAEVWSALKGGSAGPPDYTVSSESWPGDFSDWPMILVPGSDTLTGSHTGQGLIVVTGELTLQPSFEWQGLILSGGGLVAEGSYLEISGSVIAGLNRLEGSTPRTTDLGTGTKLFEQQSCNTASALQGVDVTAQSLAEEPGTWHESI